MATVKGGKYLLLGNSGEYFVMAELLRNEKTAGLLPRNTPNWDILATNGSKEIKIRAKTKSKGHDGWQWNAKNIPTIA